MEPMKSASKNCCNVDDENKKNNNIAEVAIVGAGFAGLVLANFLIQSEHQQQQQQQQQQRQSDIRFQIFESRSEPVPICGGIRLPNARRILKELNLFLPMESSSQQPRQQQSRQQQQQSRQQQQQATGANNSRSSNKNNNNGGSDMYAREDILHTLRKGINIQYSCCITRVEKQKAQQQQQQQQRDAPLSTLSSFNYFLFASSGKGDEEEEERKFGPFNAVIVATGWSVPPNVARHAAFAIGDARRRHRRRWDDFIGRRRRSGGDLAMCEGLELGTWLTTVHRGRRQPSKLLKQQQDVDGQFQDGTAAASAASAAAAAFPQFHDDGSNCFSCSRPQSEPAVSFAIRLFLECAFLAALVYFCIIIDSGDKWRRSLGSFLS